MNGIAGTDATITFYSESENASGVIGLIGAYGDDGKMVKQKVLKVPHRENPAKTDLLQ